MRFDLINGVDLEPDGWVRTADRAPDGNGEMWTAAYAGAPVRWMRYQRPGFVSPGGWYRLRRRMNYEGISWDAWPATALAPTPEFWWDGRWTHETPRSPRIYPPITSYKPSPEADAGAGAQKEPDRA